MLLLHQTGSVKVGEVVRYTLTYTPSADRILPAPKHLHVKVKNTSAIPLRAAYLHGPYTLYVACYPSTFDPNSKHVRAEDEGVPEYEPNLKAGAHWNAKLTVPEEVREAAGGPQSRQSLDGNPRSFTWIIELASQVIFSTTAAVHFEVLVGRDERSVDLGFHTGAGTGQGAPGKLEDHQQGRSRNAAQPKGVYSKAVRLAVDDTDSLWNTPAFPTWEKDGMTATDEDPHHGDKMGAEAKAKHRSRNKIKVHLVVLTHGLHSNLGADMLYLKESIDTAAKQAREDRRRRKAERRNNQLRRDAQKSASESKLRALSTPEIAVAPTQDPSEDDSDEDEEQVIVRGFTKNAVKTENGIQYLGKRLAKWVLCITYPDQPYLPAKSSIAKSLTRSFTSKISSDNGQPTHRHSSIVKDEEHQNDNLAYKITSISFISHSLGGNIQTYAIAYIQKHSPEFFDLIKPINFVAMASPFLGLSNENPIYVKFALDFGLVGRTGQDLGLTWKPPTIARSGWEVMIGGLSGESQKARRQPNPAAKPLLRVLPAGPAHIALKKFRNRTVYSNVVNDGIVPLRTSCLLFLDWRGLGRVEKARRENGLVGTMVGWGWSEMTGQNASSPRRSRIGWNDLFNDSGEESDSRGGKGSPDHRKEVPQPSEDAKVDNETMDSPREGRFLNANPLPDDLLDCQNARESSPQQPGGIWAGLLSLIKPQPSPEAQHHHQKIKKIYYRGQIRNDSADARSGHTGDGDDASSRSNPNPRRKALVRGSSLYTNDSQNEDLEAPPKTTFFESAGDVLNPPLPPKEYLIDPEARPRTIFHDRIYHPEDIPPPPTKRRRSFRKTSGSRDATPVGMPNDESTINNESGTTPESGSMKIEEKIARAYHKDLSWRKVLVRLEPDAHNNMIVRRMFANAYGWPVVKHLCDTHFAYTAATQIPDEQEENKDRAKASNVSATRDGEEVYGQTEPPDDPTPETEVIARARSASPRYNGRNSEELRERMHTLVLRVSPPGRTESEVREATDEVKETVSPTAPATAATSYLSLKKKSTSRLSRQDSAKWSDRFFEGTDDDTDDEDYLASTGKERTRRIHPPINVNVAELEIADVLTQSPRESTVSLPVTAEPEPWKPTGTEGQGPASGRGVLGLTSIGLNKRPEEHMTPAQEWRRTQEARRKAHPSLGLVEKIAIARAKKSEDDGQDGAA